MQATRPGVTPKCSWVSLVMAAPLLGLPVDDTTDASQSIESLEVVVLVVEEDTDNVKM